MSRNKMQKGIPESDALLMSMHRQREQQFRDLMKSSTPVHKSPYDPRISDVNTRNHRLETESDNSNIMERLNKNPYLSKELRNQYGGRMFDAVNQEFVTDEEHKEKGRPRLIDEIIATRNKQYSERQQENALQLRALNEERRRLMEARERLHEQRAVSADDDLHTNRSTRRVTINADKSKESVFDVGQYISSTENNIPAQTQHLNRLKQEYEDRLQRIVRPYRGELGPQSYQAWQMSHYHMARSIVEDVVERFLDLYFRGNQPVVSNDQAVALMEADAVYTQKRRDGLREAKITQLLMEELVFEETSAISREIAREYRNLHGYVQNKTNMFFMRQAEAIAIGDPQGRPEDDPLFNLITKGFFSAQKERFRRKNDLWSHRLPTKLRDEPKNQDAEPEAEDDEVEVLYFGDVIPMETREYTPRPHDDYAERLRKRKFAQYMVAAKNYWKKMWCEVKEIEISPKCQGITASAISWNNRFLALGTANGDLFIYDIAARPYRLIRAVPDVGSQLGAIRCITWSLDGSKLITTNPKGGSVRAWMWSNTGMPLDSLALKNLSIKPDEAGYWPTSLRNVLDLNIKRRDTIFQTGPFAEMDLQKNVYGPVIASFFPSMSFLGMQNHACVALTNGDILKCDLEESYRETLQTQNAPPGGGAPMSVTSETPKIYKPTIPIDMGVSYIGQGVPSELFRQHKFPVICMGYVNNTRNMVSVDIAGFINTWCYHPRTLNSYNYFRADKQYRIDFNKTMYVPHPTANPVVIFTEKPTEGAPPRTRQQIAVERADAEKTLASMKLPDPWHKQGAPPRTRQQIAVERANAEKTLASMKLPDPWHKQPPSADGREVSIFAPLEQVSDSGAIFHVVVRRKTDNTLTSYTTRVYKPVKIKSDKMIGCKLTPDGKELIFVFLFAEYPPKTAHVTIVRIDISEMVVVDWRRDITVDSALFSRIKNENVVSFGVSQVHGVTGTAYIFLNIAGDLHGYSLTSGLKVLRSFEHANPNKTFNGATVGASDFKISDSAEISVANYAGRFYLIISSTPLRESQQIVKAGKTKKLHNRVLVVELLDFNKDASVRQNVWQLYKDRPDKAAIPPNTHVVNLWYSRTALNHHRTAYVKHILNDLIDDVIESKTRQYTNPMLDAFEDLDRVRCYEELKPEVISERYEDEEYDATDMYRGSSP